MTIEVTYMRRYSGKANKLNYMDAEGHRHQGTGNLQYQNQNNLVYHTQQNKLRVTQWTFPLVVYLVSSVAQTRQDIEKRFSASLKGVKNEAFLVENLELKIFICILSQFYNFCKMFTKPYFIIFIDALPLQYQRYTVTFSFLTILYTFF